MKEKQLRSSKRGLTFSFAATKSFAIGTAYDYIISNDSIRIVPATTGKHRISRKKRGDNYIPLIDLRNKEILHAIATMGDLRLRITETAIIIAAAKPAKRGVILQFPRVWLANARKVVGMSDAEAITTLVDHGSFVLDEALDVPSFYEDLPDLYTVVSLFSGAGVLDWPFFKDDRFNIQYAIDYDAGAVKTYQHNIGTHIVHGDIHKAFTDDGYPLDAMVSNPDVIIGGPSCKPFSNANRHTRLDDHPDSDLLMQYMRIVRKLNPKVFAIEDVPEVLTACDGAYYNAVCETAKDAGYELTARIVQDCAVGGYTTRKRVVILGSRFGTPSFPPMQIVGKTKTVGDTLRHIDATWPNCNDVSVSSPEVMERMSYVPQGGNYTSIPEHLRTGSKNRHSCTYKRLALNEPSPTLVNWRKPPLVHPTENRTLTVAEAKALQGLPKEFRVCGTLGQMQQQIGNCVPVAIGTYIKDAILRLLGNEPHVCMA